MLRLVFLSLRSTPLLKTSFPFHGSDFLGAKYGFFSLILSRSSICLVKKNKNFLGFFNSISNRKIMPCNWYLTCTCYYLLTFAIQLAIMDCGYDLLSFFELWNWSSLSFQRVPITHAAGKSLCNLFFPHFDSFIPSIWLCFLDKLFPISCSVFS